MIQTASPSINDDRRPLIGVTPGIAGPASQREFCRNTEVVYCDVNYLRRVEEAGGVPLLLSCVTGEDSLVELCAHLDGVLLTGGEDVEPLRYGQDNHYSVTTPLRDEFELQLLGLARSTKLPVLAICRGFQVVNVHFGGTLIQDLPSEVGSLQHDQTNRTSEPTHEVELVENSRLFEIYHRRLLPVNSHHHQAVDRVGIGLRVVGWAEDGVVEAMEAEDSPYLIAVQWHPERLLDCLQDQQKLFADFVMACREPCHGR